MKSRKDFLKSFYTRYNTYKDVHNKRLHIISEKCNSDIYIRIYIYLLSVQLYMEVWGKQLVLEVVERDHRSLVDIFREGMEMYHLVKMYVLDLHKMYGEGVFSDMDIKNREVDVGKKVTFLVNVFKEAGLPGLPDEVSHKYSLLLNELFPLLYPVIDSKDRKVKVQEGDVYFQILHASPYLSRKSRPRNEKSLSNIVDPRVVFSPDEWQVELLNIVDQYGKALVQAPTASGKTFIAYYAIERVLYDYFNNSDIGREVKGRVLFVAPTKSLPNQVTSDIYARFAGYTNNSSNIKNNKGKGSNRRKRVLQGTLSGDFYININSHVLIITPEMLETINFELYDYIIIDEFHLINKHSSIERALNRMRGGILLLSATVPGSEQILEYLNYISSNNNSNTNSKWNVISTNKRFAELYTSVYDPSTSDVFSLHPYVRYLNNRESGLLKVMDLTPPDVLTLFYAIFKCLSKIPEYKKDLKSISIKKYFKYNILIREDITKWEESLVDLVNKVVEGGNSLIYREVVEYCCLESRDVLREYYDYQSIYDIDRIDINRIDIDRIDTDIDRIDTDINRIGGVEHGVQDLSIQNSIANSTIDINNIGSGTNGYKNTIELLLQMKQKQITDLLPAALQKDLSTPKFRLKDTHPTLVFILDSDSCIASAIYSYYYLLEYNDLVDSLISLFDTTTTNPTKKEEMKRKIEKMEKRNRDNIKKDKDAWKEETLLKDERASLDKSSWNEYYSFISEVDRISEGGLDYECKRMKTVFSDDVRGINSYLKQNHLSNNINIKYKQKVYTEDGKLNTQINQIIWKIRNINPSITVDNKSLNTILINMLKYGLGVHTPNLSRKYRTLIERLYKNRSVLITYSTLTLSLGINMPCRSVVFAEDSLELSSSVVKQIKGRAGRRDYDVYGNTIFVKNNFSLKRIIDLVTVKECEDVISQERDSGSDLRMVDVCSTYNSIIYSNINSIEEVYGDVECKPTKGDVKGLETYLRKGFYDTLCNIGSISDRRVVWPDLYTTFNINSTNIIEEDSSDSLFNDNSIEIVSELEEGVCRTRISDLLLCLENGNLLLLVLAISRGVVDLSVMRYEEVVCFVGVLLADTYSIDMNNINNINKDSEYAIRDTCLYKTILSEKLVKFIEDVNSLSNPLLNISDRNLIIKEEAQVPHIDFVKQNKVYDLLINKQRYHDSWTVCMDAVRIFRCLCFIFVDGEIATKLRGWLKRVESELREIEI